MCCFEIVEFFVVQNEKSAVPLQWAWRAKANRQWGDLGLQPELHAVHPHVHLRPAGRDHDSTASCTVSCAE